MDEDSMKDYNQRITDQKPEYFSGCAWPFVLSAIFWGVILGVWWAW